jgi:hypothetical protein
MKIFMTHADIRDVMPPFALQAVAMIVALITAVSAFVGNSAPAGSAYPTTVKLISGFVTMAGSMYLARAISLTLLRSGGTPAFQTAYVSAVALGGLGAAEALSACWPANIGQALAAYCVVTAVSGLLWVRFYGCAT